MSEHRYEVMLALHDEDGEIIHVFQRNSDDVKIFLSPEGANQLGAELLNFASKARRIQEIISE